MSKWKWDGSGEVEVLRVCEAMNLEKPENKKKSDTCATYQQIATQWLGQMPYELLSKRRYSGSQLGQQVSLVEVRKKFQYRYRKSGKVFYWLDWFEQNFPLWHEITKGNSIKCKVSEVMFNFNPLQALSGVTPEQVFACYEQELQQLVVTNPNKHYQIDVISVDLENVQRYIKQTQESIPLQQNQNLKKQMQINLAEALVIEAFCLATGNVTECPITGNQHYLVPQVYYTHKTFARRYYVTSIAFQNMHRKLREVITGTGWAMDLNSSVWSFYKFLCAEAGIESSIITEMIQDKNKFRNSIASVLVNTPNSKRVPKVKQAITALGFGARDTAFSGLDKIIRDTAELQAFTAHPKIQELKHVQQQLLDWIKQEYQAEISALKADPEFTTSRSFNYKKFLAMLYQRYETIVMQELIEFLTDSGSEVVLWVHDGVYLRGKRPDAYWDSLIKGLNPHASAEVTRIESQVYSNPAQHYTADQHATRMAEEQKSAEAWARTAGFTSVSPVQLLAQIRALNSVEPELNTTPEPGVYTTSSHIQLILESDPDYLVNFYSDK